MNIPCFVGLCVLLFGPLVSVRPHVLNCGSSRLSASKYSWRYLSSPGHPNYNHTHSYMYCKWTISAPAGYTIKVQVQNISMEYDFSCSKDYVLFRDGSSSYAKLLGKYCSDHTGYIVSSRNSMSIIFRTGSSVKGSGFSLKYVARNAERPHVLTCGSSRLGASKYSWSYFSSPGYPDHNYNNNMFCEWTISAPAGYTVKVQVQNISMENDSSCSQDYVLFGDGSPSYATRLGKYCSDHTGYIVSSLRTMTITFRTDSSVTDRGFRLKYIAQTAVCGEDDAISNETKYVESPNFPMSYPVNAGCEWTISTSIYGYVIHVEVVYFNIEYAKTCSYDYVQLYDVTSYERSIGRWCGIDGPNTQTTGQTMKVIFHSDGSTSGKGFKLSFTAGDPTSRSAASTNIGAILGGVFSGIAAVGIAACCCCGVCLRKKHKQQRNRSREGTVSFINVPSYPQTTNIAPTYPTSPTEPPFMSPSPPCYNDVVKNGPPPYCQAVPLSDIQPVVTSSPSGASECQGIDNPAGPR